MDQNPWELSEAVDRLQVFRKAREWEKFHQPKELATALSIEGAELLEQFLWKGLESAMDVKNDTERMPRIREEVADIGILLLMFANDLDINLSEAIHEKISSNELRYNVEDHRGVAKKAN